MPRAKKRKEDVEKGSVVAGYVCVNQSKLHRAIYGSAGRAGTLVGGVGKDAPEEKILAQYDKLGGLILTQEGDNVKTGSFWDFENKKEREKPEVVLQFRDLLGKKVEIPEGDKVPQSVQAAEIAKEERRKEKLAKQKAKEEAKEEQKRRNKKVERDDE